MTSKFSIKNVFPLPSRNYLIISGDILEGEIRKGMHISFTDKQIPIDNIEMVDKKDGSLVGLVIKYKDDNEKMELEKILNGFKVVEITE